MADLPYREIIGGIETAAPARINPSIGYSYSLGVLDADRFARALQGDGPAEGGTATSVGYLRNVVGQCSAQSDMLQAMHLLVDAAARTLGYLDRSSRERLWSAPAWITCDALAPQVRSLLDVIAALARRDGTTAAMQADQLLRDPALQAAPDVRDWLLRAAMLGAIDAGRFAAVEQLESVHGKDVTSNAMQTRYRAWMRNYARQRLATAPPKP